MDTLDELKVFCNEVQPVGALMLTGEWGCGKTYLIENILKEELKDTHVLLRISLFGMDTIEEIKNEVKKRWIYEKIHLSDQESKIVDNIKKYGKLAKNLMKKGSQGLPEPLKFVVKNMLSINAIDLIKIEEKIGEKKVILIFDDLERTNIKTSSLLGCINEYCENFHINTIVVANEEKIRSEKENSLQYKEIKEKIIQRTIKYRPDFSTIIDNIINNMICKDAYKEILCKNKEQIKALFSGNIKNGEDITLSKVAEIDTDKRKEILELLKKRPNNIRSFKCAIKEFERVFDQLEKHKIPNKEKWLFSYLAIFLCFRADLITEINNFEEVWDDRNVLALYPGFYDDRYIVNSIVKWVRDGDWNQREIDKQLKVVIDRNKVEKPADRVRINRILDLDEKDINEGYAEFLEEAYLGNLELNDYIKLTEDSYWARKYKIKIPVIEWDKINIGVDKKIQKLLTDGEEQIRDRMLIDKKVRNVFKKNELDVYDKITYFLDNDILIYEKNKKLYIDGMKKNPMETMISIGQKRFNRFDQDMANATLDGFKNICNVEKRSFCKYFNEMWKVKIYMEEYKQQLDSSCKAMKELKTKLEKLRDKYERDSLMIARLYTDRFWKNVLELIDMQEELADQKRT